MRSASRVPTPSPTATARAPCLSQNSRNLRPASPPPSVSPASRRGCTTDAARTAPVSDTAASLHPVRCAGSKPTTGAAGRMGGARMSAATFAPKSWTARRIASSRSLARVSRSAAGRSSRLIPSLTATSTSAAFSRRRPLFTSARVAAMTAGVSSHSTFTRTTPAASARHTARYWCGWILCASRSNER